MKRCVCTIPFEFFCIVRSYAIPFNLARIHTHTQARKLARIYTSVLGLNVWTFTAISSATQDAATNKWHVARLSERFGAHVRC
ncbi:hypothetical protein GALMADRAFT_1066402 [Galerina marginata CBS 339.88]|uniref:Uncharacterized protein n=1 Tax=Galerina marginata (strain CBS 339.88) TaxID=685588 RepID=A0A067SAE0_GALM3|nr:hypothetical protein GALMADRAFT_1066402 [Galerina marginata CBS 339.88]